MGRNTMANKVEAFIGQDAAVKAIYDDVTHLSRQIASKPRSEYNHNPF